LKKNQDKSSHGGARSGAGRKKGTPNKATAALKEVAGQYTEAAVLALADIMADESQPSSARVSAANSLLDRAHGKPSQSVDVSGDMTFQGLTVTVTRSPDDAA